MSKRRVHATEAEAILSAVYAGYQVERTPLVGRNHKRLKDTDMIIIATVFGEFNYLVQTEAGFTWVLVP